MGIWNERGELFVLGQFLLLGLIFFLPNQGGLLAIPVIGIALSVFGWLQIILGAFFLGRNLTPSPKPKQRAQLVTTGIFAFSRHPIYGGLLLIAFGSAIWHGSAVAFFLSALLAVLLEFKSRREEMWLRQMFAGYAVYAKKVKKFIPYVY